jgi:hypothetical protein
MSPPDKLKVFPSRIQSRHQLPDFFMPANKKCSPIKSRTSMFKFPWPAYLAAFSALIFAHLAFCPAAILARPAALIL